MFHKINWKIESTFAVYLPLNPNNWNKYTEFLVTRLFAIFVDIRIAA